jgi:hypothetical protein
MSQSIFYPFSREVKKKRKKDARDAETAKAPPADEAILRIMP